jgi:GLPGLI family protein
MIRIILFFACANTYIVPMFAQSQPVSRVIYLRDVSAAGELMWNGMTSLYYNQNYSIFVHHQAPLGDTSFFSKKYDSMASFSGDSTGFPIYKMHKERKIMQKVECRQVRRGTCIVTDTLGTINWEIKADGAKEIGGFACEKAVATFRGRTYEAWFAPDLPVSSGPFKFFGLPGLILEIKSTDDVVKFSFHSLELNRYPESKLQPPTNGLQLNMDYPHFIEDWNLFIAKEEKEMRATGMDITITRAETIEIIKK